MPSPSVAAWLREPPHPGRHQSANRYATPAPKHLGLDDYTAAPPKNRAALLREYRDLRALGALPSPRGMVGRFRPGLARHLERVLAAERDVRGPRELVALIADLPDTDTPRL